MIDGRLLAIGTFALLLPVSIENPAARDSAVGGGETRITVVGGFGNYAVIDRGCNGNVIDTHPHEFSEAGLEARHQFANKTALGVRTGVIRDRAQERVTDGSVFPPRDSIVEVKEDVTYYNFYAATEGRLAGVGVGWILSSGDFGTQGERTVLPWSAHLRLGHLDGPFFRIAVMEGLPLYTGGGYAELGFGWRPSRLLDVYAGMNGGPYDGPGLMAKIDWRVRRNFAVIVQGRAGNSGGESQNGLGLGVSYISAPPREPDRGAQEASMAGGQRRGSIESSWGLAPKRPPAVKDTMLTPDAPPPPPPPPEL